jgi:hypothetical protein
MNTSGMFRAGEGPSIGEGEPIRSAALLVPLPL